jgi:hypothetical protein
VLDTLNDASDNIHQIFFNYQVNGVEYESSQSLNQQQRAQQASYAPGARLIIRYDPHQPANSVVV